jgi:uncharacterized glyoxalase superfamily protein PhnB
MATISSVTLEVDDLTGAQKFYAAAFGLDERLRFRASDAATTGFRGFTLSLVVSRPATVQGLFDSAVAAGATPLKPVATSLWGIGGGVQAPDGTIWTIATSNKKDDGPATRDVDNVVLLIGADDVGASKKFYVEHGLTVGKSFGNYVDFALEGSPIGLGLYKRKALAKTAGVPVEGSGSHRVVLDGDLGAFTDPDGFSWS